MSEALALNEFDRSRLVALVRHHTGLIVDPAKLGLLVAKAWPRLQAEGLQEVGQLPTILGEGPASARLWLAFIPALTVNETYFRREAAQLDAFATEVLPDLRHRAALERRPIRLLSAGCATGEEAYTLAALIQEAGVGGEVLGVDLDPEALAIAEAGHYGVNALRGLGDAWRERLLDPVEAKRWVVKGALRQAVRFRQLNLMQVEEQLAGERFDAIFCRNVLIYFDRDTQLKVVQQLRSLLRPEACLFLGHSEIFFDQDLGLEPVVAEAACWFRKSQGAHHA